MFLMSSQVKKSCQCQLRDQKQQYFSIVSLPTDSVIIDHAVFFMFINNLIIIALNFQ
jgi:DNA repair protein RadC